MATLPVIDGYTDLVRVAQGGFGVVYRARQDRFSRMVALKVLGVENLVERDRQRFERECTAMGSLSWHPNVVAVYDSGITDDGRPYLAMEFLDAGSLADRLSDGPLPWDDAVVAGIQVAGALDAAHAVGTLHRDLKPENILVGPYGEAKLGDFGIAAVENAARTTTGHASFSVDHVTPEVLRGQRPDERSDLYGLASTLHTLISGTSPFAGDPDAPPATQMMRVLEAPPPRLSEVPDELADLLVLTLAKDPDARPRSAEEFGRALQHLQAGNGQAVTDLRLAPRTSSGDRVGATTNVDSVPAPESVGGDPRLTLHDRAPQMPQGDPLPTISHAEPGGPQVDLDTFQSKRRCDLLDERAAYERQAESLEAEAASLIAERKPDNTQFDTGSDDGDPLAVERERDLALSAQARAAVNEIDAALERLDAGTYGICERCGKNIGKPRLDALPHAALCIDCKAGGLGRL